MEEKIEEMLIEHIDSRIYHMETDKTYTSTWLLGESILASTTDLERIYLDRMLNRLVACGYVDIGIAELNEAGEHLYCRVD